MQWVLTLPHRLRYLLAWRHDLCRSVARILHAAIERHLRTWAFDLHAGVRVPAGQRDRLERVCRYALRPPLADQRITITSADVAVRLRRRGPMAPPTWSSSHGPSWPGWRCWCLDHA